MKKLTRETIEKMAYEIQKLCIKKGWGDTIIYFNNKRIFADYYKHTNEEVEENVNPHDYFEYAAYDHILSMSFEGGLYDYIYNNIDAPALSKVFEKYGVYFELGNQWNLSVFPINDTLEVEYTVYKRPKEREYIIRWKINEYSDPRIKALISLYEVAMQGKKPYGSCIIGDGIEFELDGNPYKFDTNWQQSDAPGEVINICKEYLKSIGATAIYYNPGRLD